MNSLLKLVASALLASTCVASHLDDTDSVLSGFEFDLIKFKTKTDCQLDTYPGVSNQSQNDTFSYPNPASRGVD